MNFADKNQSAGVGALENVAFRIGLVKSVRLCFWLPFSSKFRGSSQARKAASRAGHSVSIAANHAVSLLLPLSSVGEFDVVRRLDNCTRVSSRAVDRVEEDGSGDRGRVQKVAFLQIPS